MGAAVMPHLVLWRLGGTLIAFFLTVGIGAHVLDELHGRPLRTGIGSAVLAISGAVTIGAAMAMGLLDGGLRLLPFVVLGGMLVAGYNLEHFGGVLHCDVGFAASWGAFPVLLGAYAQHWTLSLAAGAAAVTCRWASARWAPPARMLRRRVTGVSVRVTFTDGSEQQLSRADLLAPIERALRYFVCATGLVALAMVLTWRAHGAWAQWCPGQAASPRW
jgi:hypothetical protein